MKISLDQTAVVILAGGFGTRIKHLLRDLPKPMAPVRGRPFVEWVVRYLKSQGIRNVVLSTGYLAETIETHFRANPIPEMSVRCVAEPTPLGTAGGFLNAIGAEKNRPEAWLVLNGDSLALAPLGPLFGSLTESGIQGAVLGVPMKDASRYGTISQDAYGRLTGFNEKRPGEGIINAGVYLFDARLLPDFPSRMPLSFELDVFPEFLSEGRRLKVCVTDAPFLDIGTPESLPCAADFIRNHMSMFASE